MPDIKELLFPNILTLLSQLAATGVIYLLYRKYVHAFVLDILDKKATDYQAAYEEIESLNKQQTLERQKFEQEKASQHEVLERSKQMMLKDIEAMRDKLIADTNLDIERMKKQAKDALEKEKQAMLEEVEQELVSVAFGMTEKVLEGYRFDEAEMLQALEKEMDKAHVRS